MSYGDPENFMDYEREAARDAAAEEWPEDRPTRAEVEADERLGPYRIAEDVYRGVCGGCGQPVSASRSHRGGHEGSCLWTGGPWHPSCRRADPAWQAKWGTPTTKEPA